MSQIIKKEIRNEEVRMLETRSNLRVKSKRGGVKGRQVREAAIQPRTVFWMPGK